MRSEEQDKRCQALTQAGEPCKNYPVEGSRYCHVHQPAAADELSAEEQRRLLAAELDDLIRRLQALTPGYEPPSFSPRRLLALAEESLKKLPRVLRLDVLGELREGLGQNATDPEFWKGVWYMANYTLRYNADMLKRHYTGEYDTDAWGLDQELLDVMRPFFNALYKVYWRVEASGLDHVPVEGRALLVANRAGPLPWDSLMLTTAVLTEHSAQRLVRVLHAEWLSTVPFFAAWPARLGQVPDTGDNGLRLLEQDEVVAVFPEGDAGAAKSFKRRYQLARFGQGEFVQMALQTGAPVIPVSIVGAEETYVTLGHSRAAARLAGLPYVPITTGFPWLGLLGLVPLPTKWHLDFGEPLALDDYGPDAALNLVLVSQLADRVRHTLQGMLHERLAERRSVFR